MTSRSPLDRQTPVVELDKFRSFCEERCCNIHEAASEAVLEFLPGEYVPSDYRTDGHRVEDQLMEDLRHANLAGDSSMKKSGLDENERDRLDDQDTEKCRIHIDDSLLEALEKFVVTEEGKKRGEVGVYFAVALSEYRDGGQLGRVREWYARLRDNMDFLPEDRETRIDTIVSRVEEQLAERDSEYINKKTVNDLIREVTDAEVENALREYRQRVFDELGFVEVATSNGVYAPPEVAEEMQADAAMDDLSQEQYDAMDREARVEHLRTALRQRAEASDGSAGFTYTEVIKKVFSEVDGPSHNYAYSLMDDAGEASGFRYGEHRDQKRLRFNEQWLGASEEWFDPAVESVGEFCDTHDFAPHDAPENVVTNKIAASMRSEEFVEVADPETVSELVGTEDRERVLAELTGDDSDTTTAKIKREEEEAAMDELTDALEAEPSEVVTDGGFEEAFSSFSSG